MQADVPVQGPEVRPIVSVMVLSGRACRTLLLPGLAAVLLALAACDEVVEFPPGCGGPPHPPGGSFTTYCERVVGFPSLFPAKRDGSPEEERIRAQRAEAEAARVTAMHERGGTGAGQLVGTIESGANPQHPDLTGKFPHICAMGDCDDGRPNRQAGDRSPRFDLDGHGTQVNGIIAARRNGTGVYGVAHEARIASFGHAASTVHPWGNDCYGGSCPPGAREKRHQWSALFDQEIARGVDWMTSLGVRVTNFSWGRTYEWSREKETRFGLTEDSVRSIMPVTLGAFEAYVGAGGVAVWAAGNGDSLHPVVEGMLPRYFPALEKGWLAVVGIGRDGRRIGHFSHYCGDAAAWCIAAPGVVVTTDHDGRWIDAGGTSIAAPYVAAGLAALKSLFPNLTHHQIRDCMLATADRRPPYDDRRIYGQGRLDLDAASRRCGAGR